MNTEKESESTVVIDPVETAVPLDREAIKRILSEQKFHLRGASIREMNNLVNTIEEELALRFVRMEFGIPGLPVNPAAIEAETAALRDRQVGHVYAPFEGVPELKAEAARFAKLFMNVELTPECCVPTIGAMEGCFASMALAGRMRKEPNGALPRARLPGQQAANALPRSGTGLHRFLRPPR